jgi:hypothetical protein
MRRKAYTAEQFARGYCRAVQATLRVVAYKRMIAAQRRIMGEDRFVPWALEHGFRDVSGRKIDKTEEGED